MRGYSQKINGFLMFLIPFSELTVMKLLMKFGGHMQITHLESDIKGIISLAINLFRI